MNTTGEVQQISQFLLQGVWKTPRVDFCSTLTIGCESSQHYVKWLQSDLKQIQALIVYLVINV